MQHIHNIQKMTQPKLFTRGKKLWIRFSLNGKAIKKSINLNDTKINRKIANTQIIPQMILKVNSGEFFKNNIVPTVEQMIKISFDIHRANRKYLTMQGYEFIAQKYILSNKFNSFNFRDKPITSIKPSQLSIWQNSLLELGLSTSYVQNARRVFYTVFQDALRDEIIDKNPFVLVPTISIKYLKEINPFTKDEIFKILDNLNPKVRAFFAIGFFTGARTGEITALQYKDIDFINKTISITKTRNKGIQSTPKTKSSVRVIDILEVLEPYLNEHLKAHKDRFQDRDISDDYLFISNHQIMSPYYSANILSRTYWQPLLKKLKIEYRNIYQMRHTFASMMINNGEDILWVSNMLGHKNSNITLQVYAKYIKDEKKQRAKFLTR